MNAPHGTRPDTDLLRSYVAAYDGIRSDRVVELLDWALSLEAAYADRGELLTRTLAVAERLEAALRECYERSEAGCPCGSIAGKALGVRK